MRSDDSDDFPDNDDTGYGGTVTGEMIGWTTTDESPDKGLHAGITSI